MQDNFKNSISTAYEPKIAKLAPKAERSKVRFWRKTD